MAGDDYNFDPYGPQARAVKALQGLNLLLASKGLDPLDSHNRAQEAVNRARLSIVGETPAAARTQANLLPQALQSLKDLA